MGVPVLILGESGSGKSTSLRNFEPGEIGILNVTGKPLPFRKKLAKIDRVSYGTIERALTRNKQKAYAIDDSQYLMAFDAFTHAKETGYNKFTDMAIAFKNLLDIAEQKTTEDTIIYFLHHIETTDSGKIKAKTLGKMLDSMLTVEGMFSMVLLCRTDGQRHWFDTCSDGYTPVKTPLEMFADREIDNDLKLVDTTIRDYYGFMPLTAKGE